MLILLAFSFSFRIYYLETSLNMQSPPSSVKDEDVTMASCTKEKLERSISNSDTAMSKDATIRESLSPPPPPPNNTPCNSISAKTSGQVMSLLNLNSNDKSTTTTTTTTTLMMDMNHRSQSRLQSIFPDSAVRLHGMTTDSFQSGNHFQEEQNENANPFTTSSPTTIANRKRRASSSSSLYKISMENPSSDQDSLRQSRLREIQVQLRSLNSLGQP